MLQRTFKGHFKGNPGKGFESSTGTEQDFWGTRNVSFSKIAQQINCGSLCDVWCGRK